MQLFELVEQLWKNDTSKRHAVLIGEGGSGKTTQLKKLWQDHLSHNSALNTPIPIYIPLDRFDGDSKYIQNQIIKNYCGQLDGKSDDQNRTNLLHLFKQTGDSPRRFILLLDGINEATSQNQLVKEIKDDLLECKNLQIIISSRYKLNDFSDFTQLQVKPLTVDFVKNKLKENLKYKDYQFSDKLLSLLANPMYLSMFLGLELDVPEIETKNITSAGEIFKANNERLIALEKKEHGMESDYYKTVQYCLKYLFPYFAHSISKISFTYAELCNELKQGNNYFKNNFEEYENIVVASKNFNQDDIIEILTTKHLIEKVFTSEYKKTQYKFSHENYLQFYAGLYYYNEMKFCSKNQVPACLTDSLLSENLLSWIGEIFGEHKFTNKTSLEVPKSPLENWLHNHCESDLSTCEPNKLARATCNVVEIMKAVRNNCITADYSYLDLSQTVFYGCDLTNSTFDGTINVKLSNFISEHHNQPIKISTISPDGSQFATVGEDNIIKIWDAKTGHVLKSITAFSLSALIDENKTILKKIAFSYDNTILAVIVNFSVLFLNIQDEEAEIIKVIDKEIILHNKYLFFRNNSQRNEHSRKILDFSFSPISDQCIIAYDDGLIQLLESNMSIERFRGYSKYKSNLQVFFSYKKSIFATVSNSSEKFSLELFDAEQKKKRELYNGSSNNIFWPFNKLIFSTCGRYMLFLNPKGVISKLNLWKLNENIDSISENIQYHLPDTADNCYCGFNKDNIVSFLKTDDTAENNSNTRDQLQPYSFTNFFIFINITDDSKRRIVTLKTPFLAHASYNMGQFFPDGEQFLFCLEKNVSIINTASGKLITKINNRYPLSNNYSFKDNHLAYCRFNHISLLDINNFHLKIIPYKNASTCRIAMGVQTIFVYSNGLFDNDLFKIDIETKNIIPTSYNKLDSKIHLGDRVSASPDGKLMALNFFSLDNDSNLGMVYDSEKDRTTFLAKPSRKIEYLISHKVAISPFGKYIAIQFFADIVVWNTKNGQVIACLSNTTDSDTIRFLEDFVFISDEEIAFISSQNVYSWNFLNKDIPPRTSINARRKDLKFSLEGNYLFSLSETNNKVYLIDVHTGTETEIRIPKEEKYFKKEPIYPKEIIFIEKTSAILTLYHEQILRILHLENKTQDLFCFLDTDNIQNCDFSNTNISDELKKLLEMNGGIVN